MSKQAGNHRIAAVNRAPAESRTLTERRDRQRLALRLDVRLYYGNMVYTGRVANLSETGMFICTMMTFPAEVRLLISVQSGSSLYSIPIQVKRTARPGTSPVCREESGLGVLLINPPAGYLDFVRKARASQ